MSEREADIDFDFFDEPETEEAAERPRLPRRPTNGGSRGGGPPRLRTPSGFVPMVRLAGLIAFLILAVIILVFLLRRTRLLQSAGCLTALLDARREGAACRALRQTAARCRTTSPLLELK